MNTFSHLSIHLRAHSARLVAAFALGVASASLGAGSDGEILAKPGLYNALTEPACSYVSTQHRKGLVRGDDRVLAWIRGAHNGGAMPLRHFLAGPRVLNDTYGLFFFDPDGGYVAAFKKDYGYTFHGWRRGILVVKGPDGTLWSALSGRAIDGPKKGQRLEREPSTLTTWDYWRMLHPESTAYELYDGNKYAVTDLPTEMSPEARATMGAVDSRLDPMRTVLGVEFHERAKAYPMESARERDCVQDEIAGQAIAVFWYGPTQSAAAYKAEAKGRRLTFYADAISPETAPFKDRETGTRWTLAGRAVDGPLRGEELPWVPSIQARWYAWAAEYPATEVFAPAAEGAR